MQVRKNIARRRRAALGLLHRRARVARVPRAVGAVRRVVGVQVQDEALHRRGQRLFRGE